MKQARILFFVNGPAPTPKDFAEASAIAGNVVFRNAQAVTDDPQSLEICDGVAGCVPMLYAEKFPDAETAVAKVAEELAKLSVLVGDEPAPNADAVKNALALTEQKRVTIAPTVEPPTGGGPAPTGGTPQWNPNVQS